jgi:hypothetical protein
MNRKFPMGARGMGAAGRSYTMMLCSETRRGLPLR